MVATLKVSFENKIKQSSGKSSYLTLCLTNKFINVAKIKIILFLPLDWTDTL